MKDSEVLRAASDLIKDPKVWITGDWCTLDPKSQLTTMCVEGAIEKSLGIWQLETEHLPDGDQSTNYVKTCNDVAILSRVDALETKVRRKAQELFPDLNCWNGYEDTDQALHEFNDADQVDHEMVMAALDKTASELEEAGL